MEQRKAERDNRTPGTLNAEDGYECPLCMNRGYTMEAWQRGDTVYSTARECRCMPIRRSIRRLKASGLEQSIRQYTFQNFTVREAWQQKMLDTAKRYLESGAGEGKWLFIGGAVGAGKTHICTAVAGKLLYRMPLIYASWPALSTQLKSIITDTEEYGREIRRYKCVDALYLDDFHKVIQGERGPLPPTPADIRLAYEILNQRYTDRLPTIISSERLLSELVDIDEATGSRIAERSRGYCLSIGRDRNKNQRLNAAETI